MTGRIVVAGAGSIGCYVGGMLADAGRDVALLARPRILDAIRRDGLRLTSLDGFDRTVAEGQFALTDDPAVLASARLVLVTVKSADTRAIAEQIGLHAPDDAAIVSLQNGVDNVPLLRQLLPRHRVLAGMVPFNVLALAPAHFHRATSGDIVLERDPQDIAAQLSLPAMPVRVSDDILAVQWGKLLVNLNNALNALSGLPLREQLASRAWRTLLADQMTEANLVLRAAGLRAIAATPLPSALVPVVLRWPDALFRAVAGRMLKIDPTARSSMWDDLQRRRRTEIDYLQGAIVALADRHGVAVPLTRGVIALVRAAEARQLGSPGLTPDQVRAAAHAAPGPTASAPT